MERRKGGLDSDLECDLERLLNEEERGVVVRLRGCRGDVVGCRMKLLLCRAERRGVRGA